LKPIAPRANRDHVSGYHLAAPDLAVPATASVLARYKPFGLFWATRLLSVIAFNVLAVAIGWQIYELTSNPLDLGLILLLHVEQRGRMRAPVTLGSVFAGLAFTWRTPVMLGSISLDLFVVLLGGATARSGQRRQLAVHRHLESAWRLRVRCDGRADRDGAVGGGGRARNGDGGRALDGALPGHPADEVAGGLIW
jgi:hypothetical protein